MPVELRALRRSALDGVNLHHGIGRVGRYGLVRLDGGVQMHRLTQAVLRSHLSPDETATYLRYSEALVVAARPTDPSDSTSWAAWASLLPHILVFLDSPDPSPAFLDLVCGAGWYLLARRDVLTAPVLLREWYQDWIGRLGRDDLHSVSAAHLLAQAHRHLARYDLARKLDQDNVERLREILGPDHPDTLAAASNLAVDLRMLRDVDAARQLNEDTLERRRRTLGDDHPDTLTSVSNLAVDLNRAADYAGARRLNEENLARRRRRLGAHHPDTLTSASNLAVDLRFLGDLDAALAMDEETLSARNMRLGPDHPDTLISEANRAADLRALGHEAAARSIYERVLELRRRILGDDHPDTVRSVRDLHGSQPAPTHEPGPDVVGVAEVPQPPGSAQEGADVNNDDSDSGPPSLVIETDLADVASLSFDELRRLDSVEVAASVDHIIRQMRGPNIAGYNPGGGGLSYSAGPMKVLRPVTRPQEPGPTWVVKHLLSSKQFDALADGRGDIRTVKVLERGQLSRRKLLLKALLDAVPSNRLGPLEPLDVATTLLDHAHKRAPRRAETVLMSPQVGAWLGHAMRQLAGNADSGTPDWVVAGHLHGVAAAAAIHTRIDFHARVPVWDGDVALPTLGIARVGSRGQSGVADVWGVGPHVTVTFKDRQVTVPARAQSDEPGWFGVRQVNLKGAGNWSVMLDALDRYLHFDQRRAGQLTQADEKHWRTLLHEAWVHFHGLDHDDRTVLRGGVRCIVPLPANPRLRPLSVSAADAFGGLAAKPCS